MNDIFTSNLFHTLIVTFVNLIGIGLVLAVLSTKPKMATHKWFIVVGASIVVWVDAAYLSYHTTDLATSVLWARINFFAVAVFIGAFYEFYLVQYTRAIRNKLLTLIVLGVSIIFAVISLTTDLVVKEMKLTDTLPIIIPGPLTLPYELFTAIIAITVLYYITKHYLKAKPKERGAALYLMLGIWIMVICNIIFNIIYPELFNNTNYYFIGDYSNLVLLVFTAIGIMRHRLLDIKIVATRSVFWTIAGFLVFEALTSDRPIEFSVIQLSIAVATVIAGQRLIAYVKKQEQIRQQIRTTNKRLENAIEERTEFFANISHEFKTPTTVARGNVDTSAIPSQQKESINKELERITKLTDELLELAKSEDEKTHINKEKLSVNVLVEEIADELKALAKKYKVKPILRLAPQNILLHGDKDKLERVITNLISNAIKYNKEGGSVTVSTGQEGKNLVLEVSDTGIGIPEKDLPHIFERFYRVDKQKSRQEGGTGLGLSIVKLIVDLHGGSIEVKSEENKGTTFKIKLPRL